MATEWLEIEEEQEKHWYYFGEESIMTVGWLEIDGSWYFFDENGRLLPRG